MGNYWLDKGKAEIVKSYRPQGFSIQGGLIDASQPSLEKENEDLKEQLAKAVKDMEEGYLEAYQMIVIANKQRDEAIAEKNKALTELHSKRAQEEAAFVEISNPEVTWTSRGLKVDPKDLMSDEDIYTKLLKYSKEEARDILAKVKENQAEALRVQTLMTQSLMKKRNRPLIRKRKAESR